MSSCIEDHSSYNTKIFDLLSFHQPEGFNDSLLMGTYHVFEDRNSGHGRKIPLHISITPALDKENARAPIFMIDGGPGVGVSNWAYFYTEEDTLYRKYHDLVYIDARGTGKSQPLHCYELQTTNSLEEHFDDPYPPIKLQACIDRYVDSINFSNYNTQNIVDDLEEVRKWLGYDKINIYSVSYGGKVSLLYMNKYPSSLNRVALHAPSDPSINNHIMRAHWSQQALDYLFDMCKNDSICNKNYPDLESEFEVLQNRIKNEHIQVKYGQESFDTIALNWETISKKFYSLLYGDYDYIRIPYLIHESFNSNYEPLLKEFSSSNGEPDLLFADGTFLSIICAEEVYLDYKTSGVDSTFLSDTFLKSRRQACKKWPVKDISPQYQDPVSSNVKTLIISGNLDPVTPPSTGIAIHKRLSDSKHIIIPFMGHMLSDLSNLDCYDKYVAGFFDEADDIADVDCFESMKPSPFITSLNSDPN